MKKEKRIIKSHDMDVSGILNDFGIEQPLAILSHGFASSKDNTTYTILEELLSEFKISSFRYDFYGHGESSGKLEDITTTRAIQNLSSVYEYFKEKGYQKIGLVGSSFGGFVSMLCAPNWKDLQFLALKCPVSDFEAVQRSRHTEEVLNDWKQKGYHLYNLGPDLEFKINYSFFEDLMTHNGYKKASSIQIPTIIIHGTADESVPHEQSIELQKLIPNSALVSILGADHRFSENIHFDRMISLIFEHILKNSGV